MAIPDAVRATARAGADSVFGYLERTAEAVPDGVRWQTLSYENRRYYDANPFNGVGGLPFFLAGYHAATGSDRALDLAVGAARWCTGPDRTFLGSRWSREHQPAGLWFARGGVALAWVRLAQVTGDGSYLDQAREIGDAVAAAPVGPVTDYLGGAAGEGIALIRLWQATGESRYRDAARARAAWLQAAATHDDHGCHWPVDTDDPGRRHASVGFAHGAAGIGDFFLLLFDTTGAPEWERTAHEAAEALLGQARPALPPGRGRNWPPVFGQQRAELCQWCHGAPGVGLFFAHAARSLGDARFLDAACAAGETTFARGDARRNPTQCHGLAGNAELFLELYRLTRQSLWLERAHDFARRALSYRVAGPGGDSWQADEPGLSSPDYMCGAAGTGHFFLRLWNPLTLEMPLR